MWATVYEELTFLSLNIVGWTIVAASFSCWRIVDRSHKVSKEDTETFAVKCSQYETLIGFTDTLSV